MISSPASKKRILVPRWRPLAATIAAGELSSPAPKGASISSGDINRQVVKRLERWRLEPAVLSAAEVLEAALVNGLDNEAIAPARLLVRPGSGATSLVRHQAARLLVRTGHAADALEALEENVSSDVATLRQRTRDCPQDALAWVELALAQVSHPFRQRSDRKTPAERSISVALKLAHNNRHVLRSAARFYLHLHEPDRAHDLIRRSDATPNDPWLMAAEIALAECTSRPPAFMKKGISLLDEGGQVPRQITELAGAVGSVFLHDGKHKRGQRLFAQSMLDPTGNALAQAEWISQRFDERFVSNDQLHRHGDAREARSIHAFQAGHFESALQLALQWIEEESYSTRAYATATSAANVAEDHLNAERLARRGLIFDPRSSQLRNGLAFSLASQGRLDEAQTILNTISADSEEDLMALVADANRGLIAIRVGDFERGVALYRKCIAGFRAAGNLNLARAAQAYLTREAVRAKLPDAEKFLREAKDGLSPSTNPVAARVVKSVEALLETANQKKT